MPERALVLIRVASNSDIYAIGDHSQSGVLEEYVIEGTAIGIARGPAGADEATAKVARDAATAMLDVLDSVIRDPSNYRLAGTRKVHLGSGDIDQGVWDTTARICVITFGIDVRASV